MASRPAGSSSSFITARAESLEARRLLASVPPGVPGEVAVDVVDGELRIVGDPAASNALIVSGTWDDLLVTAQQGGEWRFRYSGVVRVIMHGGDADDELRVDVGVGTFASFDAPPAVLFGYGGDDTLLGGGGDDTLDGGAGADVMDGRGGFDTADYSGRLADVVASIGDGAGDGEAGEGDDISARVERIVGGAGNDTLSLAGIAWEDITASTGHWLVPSYNEPDIGRIHFVTLGDPVEVRQFDQSRLPELVGGDGDDTLLGHHLWASRLIGGRGNDRLEARLTNDGKEYHPLQSRLSGGQGDDTLIGGAGNDWLRGGPGRDLLRGGGGLDYADYREHAQGVIVDLTLGVGGIDGQEDVLEGITHVVGSGFADRLIGNDADNHLLGWAGNDTLLGGGGNDLLLGGAGDDRLEGGEGDDALHGDLDRLADRSGRSKTRQEAYELMELDPMFIGSGSDTLLGGAGYDTLHGGAGSDVIDGGGNGAVAVYVGHERPVVVDLGAGIAGEMPSARAHPELRELLGQYWDRGPVSDDPAFPAAESLIEAEHGVDEIAHVADVVGSRWDDLIFGDDKANVLRGGPGADIIFGRGGNDRLGGGPSEDERGEPGVNWLFGGDNNDFFESADGTGDGFGDRLLGGRGHDRAYSRLAESLMQQGYFAVWTNRVNTVLDDAGEWNYGGSGTSGAVFIKAGGVWDILDFGGGGGRKPPY